MNDNAKYPAPSQQIQQIVLPFGKFKGYKLYGLVNYVPAYVVWLHEKSQYKVPAEVLEAALYVLENRKRLSPTSAQAGFALPGWWSN